MQTEMVEMEAGGGGGVKAGLGVLTGACHPDTKGCLSEWDVKASGTLKVSYGAPQ